MELLRRSDWTAVVCTPAYARRSSGRTGGVGFESQILTRHIVDNMNSNDRIIPLLRSGEARESVPQFLPPQLYLDFRKDESYQATLELLLRRIFDSPTHSRPPLGKPPSFSTAKTPRKWVLVAGSGREDTLSPVIDETSRMLGSALAESDFGLVTGGWQGVDRAVARAFATALYTRDSPLDRYLLQVVREDWKPVFPGGNLVFVAPGDEEWTKPLEQADAVVLIEGFGGTLTTGHLARRMGKPVFPLADTGRDAHTIYAEILRDAQRGGTGKTQGVSREDFLTLGRSAPSVVNDLMKLLEKVFWS